MRFRQLIISVMVTVALSALGSLFLRTVFAQVSVVGPATCTGTGRGTCSQGQFCISGRCNLPQPVWNQDTTAADAAPQTGIGFYVEKSSRVTDNFTVGKKLTVGDGVDVIGNLKVTGCLGATFVGKTGTGVYGNNNGYVSAHALCNTAFSGSHVCSTEEMLGSIRCGVSQGAGTSPVFTATEFAWVNNGPPAYLAQANDCKGWTSSAADVYGAMWEFGATGGKGHLTGCNTNRVFSCCK